MRRLFLSVLTLQLLASTAYADAMRCGNKLVRDGDTQSEVRQVCGEPSDVQTRTILRQSFINRFGQRVYLGEEIEVPVETWTYNFGPYKLQRRIRFVDGLVEDIETLGYGYREKPPY
jgi:hypothetical protein